MEQFFTQPLEIHIKEIRSSAEKIHNKDRSFSLPKKESMLLDVFKVFDHLKSTNDIVISLILEMLQYPSTQFFSDLALCFEEGQRAKLLSMVDTKRRKELRDMDYPITSETFPQFTADLLAFSRRINPGSRDLPSFEESHAFLFRVVRLTSFLKESEQDPQNQVLEKMFQKCEITKTFFMDTLMQTTLYCRSFVESK